MAIDRNLSHYGSTAAACFAAETKKILDRFLPKYLYLTWLLILSAVITMGIRERRVREKEQLRRKILNAARELFAKEGYENVTMRKVAHKIEYTPTTIYLYFKDKEELVAAVCEETFAGLLEVVERMERKYSDPLEQVRAGCRAYIEFGLAYPGGCPLNRRK